MRRCDKYIQKYNCKIAKLKHATIHTADWSLTTKQKSIKVGTYPIRFGDNIWVPQTYVMVHSSCGCKHNFITINTCLRCYLTVRNIFILYKFNIIQPETRHVRNPWKAFPAAVSCTLIRFCDKTESYVKDSLHTMS